jgi:hypothetical protein
MRVARGDVVDRALRKYAITSPAHADCDYVGKTDLPTTGEATEQKDI